MKRSIVPAAGVAVLNELSRQQLQELAGHVEKQWFAANETVLKEGQMSEAVYIIESGKGRVVCRGDADETREILRLSEGELVGENALTRGTPNPGSLVAETDLEVLRIPLSDLEVLLESSP